MLKKVLVAAIALSAVAAPVSAFAKTEAPVGTGITVVESNDYVTEGKSSTVSPDWAWDAPYVTVTSTNYSYKGGGTLLTEFKNSTGQQATYQYQVTKSYSNSFNANVGVKAEVVEAGVGFSMSHTYTVQETINVTVPAMTVRKLWIAPTGTSKSFSIYNANCCSAGHYYAGSGTAYNITGKSYTINGYNL